MWFKCQISKWFCSVSTPRLWKFVSIYLWSSDLKPQELIQIITRDPPIVRFWMAQDNPELLQIPNLIGQLTGSPRGKRIQRISKFITNSIRGTFQDLKCFHHLKGMILIPLCHDVGVLRLLNYQTSNKLEPVLDYSLFLLFSHRQLQTIHKFRLHVCIPWVMWQMWHVYCVNLAQCLTSNRVHNGHFHGDRCRQQLVDKSTYHVKHSSSLLSLPSIQQQCMWCRNIQKIGCKCMDFTKMTAKYKATGSYSQKAFQMYFWRF